MNQRHHIPLSMRRRDLLKGLGATALLAPFLPATLGRAQSGGALRNLVIFTIPDGLEQGWYPRKTGPEPDKWAIDVDDDGQPHRLAPLAAQRDQLLVVTGLKSGIEGVINGHSEGPPTLWTGADGQAALSSHISIDHAIANVIGSETPYRTLHFGVQSNVTTPLFTNGYTSYSAPNTAAPHEDDPAVMYDQIFAGSTSLDSGALERTRSERGSVLDFLLSEYDAMKPLVSGYDVPKIDAHMEGVRSIERSLELLGNAECNVAFDKPAVSGPQSNENFVVVTDLQIQQAIIALQCGMTRVATLQFSNTDSQTLIPGVNEAMVLHETMHSGGEDAKVDINRFFLRKFGELVNGLAAVDLGNGRTLLDETLVVFGSEMANGNHQNDPMPFMLAGGAGSYFQMGRWEDYTAQKPRHTRLLTSIVHAFGLTDIETFGEFTDSESQGPLPGLQG